VPRAEALLAQAEKAAAQAQAELALVQIQIGKLEIKSPAAGVVTVRSIEPGEVVQAGAAALVISQLENLTVTVYLPEDRYGQIDLGDLARVTSDSFPGQAFAGQVQRIATQAEFTPRNVATEDSRRTTVFAVKLEVSSPQGELKPGMPVDVEFSIQEQARK
jgi:HlyD family secretion protein